MVDDESLGAFPSADPNATQKSEPSLQTIQGALRAAGGVAKSSGTQAAIIARIGALGERISSSVLRVAVVGQLKRGKSSLLNALLGSSILPTGITPVTSIPTFIGFGRDITATIAFEDGRTPVTASGPDQVAGTLATHVSEAANPNNALGVTHIAVTIASTLLSAGIELVDTPGIGSTFQHNTRVAQQALPECDVGLFIFSVEPPITELEVAYLSQVAALMPKVIFVLNKIDQVSEDEAVEAAVFLAKALNGLADIGQSERTIVAVSARRAIAAKTDDDPEALKRSGLPRLEQSLRREVLSNRHCLLAQAGRRRASSLIAELLFQTELERSAILMPAAQLQQKAAFFETAARTFEADRQRLVDSLAVERRAALRRLDAAVAAAWHDVRRKLEETFAETERAPSDGETLRGRLSLGLQEQFRRAFADVSAQMSEAIEARLRSHYGRADELIAQVRQAAADLMEIPFRALSGGDRSRDGREPHWSAPEAPPSLLDATGLALSALLPRALRNRYATARLKKQAESAALKNLSNLNFSMAQTIDERFRRAEAEMSSSLGLATAATRDALSYALQAHAERAVATDIDLEQADGSLTTLRRAYAALDVGEEAIERRPPPILDL